MHRRTLTGFSSGGFVHIVAAILIGGYVLAAYYILPKMDARRLAAASVQASSLPVVSLKYNRIPGDPLNVVLVGSFDEVCRAMIEAGWYLADHLRMRTLTREIKSVIEGNEYFTAPVSNLYCFGRRQDFSFEQCDGESPRKRHHVRFWRLPANSADGRQQWIGGATFDRGVGFSRLTGEITHHIAPDVDAERDKIVADLTRVGQVKSCTYQPHRDIAFNARNGEGDHYFTDGRLAVITLTPTDGITIE